MKNIIFNANSRTLDQITPNLPNMGATLTEWLQTITFTVVKKTTENFQVIETVKSIVFEGIVENVQPQNLDIRQEGQRKWRYISVWSTIDLELNPDDKFDYQRVKYRVMSKNDWSNYGYIQYECVEDYQP